MAATLNDLDIIKFMFINNYVTKMASIEFNIKSISLFFNIYF